MAREARWPVRFAGHEYPQAIPDPDDIRAGAPSPWSTLSSDERRGLALAQVEARLKSSDRLVATSSTPTETLAMETVGDAPPGEVLRRSAVLVALYEEEGETRVVLTRRSFTMRQHRGEVALPGGRSEVGESPVDTALREAREEVGLDERLVDVIGWLHPIVTFASGSAIWPVIGLVRKTPTLVASPGEVDRVFSVSLADLLADGAFLEERWRRGQMASGASDDDYFPIYLYRVPGDVVWGATARIVTELLCVVTGVEWTAAQRRRS